MSTVMDLDIMLDRVAGPGATVDEGGIWEGVETVEVWEAIASHVRSFDLPDVVGIDVRMAHGLGGVNIHLTSEGPDARPSKVSVTADYSVGGTYIGGLQIFPSQGYWAIVCRISDLDVMLAAAVRLQRGVRDA
jgi:hypothetical protein